MAERAKSNLWGITIAVAFFVVGLGVAVSYFFDVKLPTSVREEAQQLERLPNLTVMPLGNDSSLGHLRAVNWETFKQRAEGGRPFLEVAYGRVCVERRRGTCVDYEREGLLARYSLLSPAGDGSWLVSSPTFSFKERPFYALYKWDTGFDAVQLLLYRYPERYGRVLWLVALVFWLAGFVTFMVSIPSTPQQNAEPKTAKEAKANKGAGAKR